MLNIQILKKKFNPEGFNIGVNVSEAADQTVSHIYILIPRHKGDVKEPRGGARGGIPKKRLLNFKNELNCFY